MEMDNMDEDFSHLKETILLFQSLIHFFSHLKAIKSSCNTLYTLYFTISGDISSKTNTWPFITLNVRNGHKLIDWVFRIPAHIENKSRKKKQ